ncbi:MAG: hypothetical protein HYX46_11100 [Betaproteobacteria bacterium]|nr:hypothetical protein [Betaproteobacteria bacterium]
MKKSVAVRVKTVWFRKSGAKRTPEEGATVVAATLWKLADKAIDNLSRADYEIGTAERGYRVLAELLAFGFHFCDRRAHVLVADAERAAFVQALGRRLAEVLQENLRAAVDDPARDWSGEFIGFLNRRSAEYAEFEFAGDAPGFPALRCLGAQIREQMAERDQPWVLDQIMDVEMPELLGTLKKAVDGVLARGGR